MGFGEMSKAWTTEKLVDWEAALRSGNYPQARGVLATTQPLKLVDPDASEGFCCLGVACEVLALRSVEAGDHTLYYGPLTDTDWNKDYEDYSDTGLPQGAYLPFNGATDGTLYHVADELELWQQREQHGEPVKDRDGHTVSLAACNDYVPSSYDFAPAHDRKEFTQDQLADLVHYFFVVPAQERDVAKALDNA